MASRAIIRRRKYALEHTNIPVLLRHSSISTFGQEKFGCEVEQSTASQNSRESNHEKAQYILRKQGLLGLSILCHPTRGASLASYESKPQTFGFPLGARYFLQSVRPTSSTAGQPKVGILDERSENQNQNQGKKEASPEECDQAVEGLSTAKAKAKAKLVQEVQKSDQSIIHKFWAILLGIGPALRAVASMSRADWAAKLKHWKDEFVSTLQHYWLGTKLLWADEALKRKLKARMEYARFLQDTAKEMAKEVQTSRSGEMKQTAEDLDEFLNKVRKGGHVSNEEILSFAKLFNDELTLDNMNRARLVNMCKYMGIQPFGTDHYLTFMLRKKLQEIKNDDKMIQAEGVESLSEEELRQACRERGHLGLLSTEEMQNQLRDWLDLSLNHSVPSSLLILSRAFTMSGKMKPEEAVVATLSSLPDEVVDTVGTVLPSEDSVSDRKRKLEFLEMQEELIKEEEKRQEKEDKAKLEVPKATEEDVALKEMTEPTAREEKELKKAKVEHDRKEQLCDISQALAVLASASSVAKERQEFLNLVNKEIELYNTMLEKEGTEGEEEARRAYKAAREESDHAAEIAAGEKVSSALIERVDAMLQKLEKEIDDVDARIGNRWQLLDSDRDGKVTPDEVAAAANYLKDTIGKEGVQELISNLSKDKDGKILVEDIVKLASHTGESNEQEETPRQ
uniref:Mitochondrial proton/calcium exchanger protein n=1 Tax=Oryza glumipatula TaxID=40148 RepID=A0A0D9ZMM3_9ORYZ